MEILEKRIHKIVARISEIADFRRIAGEGQQTAADGLARGHRYSALAPSAIQPAST